MANTLKVIIAATPTSPLLLHLIHAFSHKPEPELTVLTRETSVSLSNPPSHSHSHTQEHAHEHDHGAKHANHNQISHIKTSFSDADLKSHLQGKDILICCLTGSDLHLSGPLVDAASSAGIKLFIPSEYGLDTRNAKIRALLPPYHTRFEVQEKLRASGLKWTAVYSGIALEDAMKTDGVLGVDVLWASAVVFPGNEGMRVPVSRWVDVAERIVGLVCGDLSGDGGRDKGGNEIYAASFRATIGEIIEAIEEELDRTFDRYEGSLEGAKKEAAERMKTGYFDGGVALMGRVAAWDSNVDAWAAWKDVEVAKKGEWWDEVKRVAKMVRNGEIGGDGCGC